jgi:hypothetical protein
MGPLSLFAVPVLVSGIVIGLRAKRWVSTAFAALFSPFAYSALIAGCDYSCGTARLRAMGLPGTEFHNVDPEWRCERVTGGCVVRGNEWVHEVPYNTVVKALIRILGPMKGAYLGPYPDWEDARAALVGAQKVAIEDLVADRIPLDGRVVSLDAGVGRGLLRHSDWQFALSDPDELDTLTTELGPITGVSWKDHCLILRVPVQSRSGDSHARSAMIVIVDPLVGRPFGYYGEGDYSHNFPPVFWIAGP